MLSLILPAALLSVCVTGSPVARHQRRAVGEVFDGPPSNTTGTNSTCYGIGIDGYNLYTGDGSPTDGWPTIGQWATYDYLWNANLPLIKNSCVNIGAIGPNNSPEETANLGSSILAIAASANVDARFILATVMQESKGCVRVQTTYGSHANPGLMQSHAGENTCGTGTNPCPASTITGMISDGVAGTPSGDGLAAILDQLSASNTKRQLSVSNSSSQAQLYYRAARTYNSGSIATTGDLGIGPGTPCYASDVANRLTGWVFAGSTCTPENVVSVRTTFPITLPAGNGTSSLNTTTTTTTPSCILVQPGATCNSVAATLGVSTATFMAANPSINAACTNMFAGVTYCA